MSDEIRWLTSSDPEPAVETLVETEGGGWWLRVYEDDEGPGRWVRTDHIESDPETWTKVAGNYGPVRVILAPLEPRRPHLRPPPPPWQERASRASR